MSTLLANISRLKPEIRLAQAVSQFEADLSSEQKTTFRTYRSQSRDSPPDPSDVMRLTAEIDRQASGGVGGRRCFGPRLTNFLQAAQQFAAVGDVVVGGSQNIIACGVWSLVRMSLLSIVNFSSYLDKLSILLMNVGCSAPRYQMMALLYSQSTNIQSYLSEYFIVVVRLCHQVLKFTKKSTIGQFASTLNDSDVKTYQSELDRWANTIKEEANLLMAKKIDEESQENFRFRALSSKYFESISLQRKMKTNLRVLDLCSKYDYETTWKQTRKVGSATLFSQNDEYRDWKGRADSCTLIYTGKLGSGKSVLLANIVDDINLHIQSKNHTVAYFFCRHDIPQSLKARTIFGSLARQLLLPIPDLAMVAEILDRTTSALDFERIFTLLQRALPPDYKAYFILDGLDECDYAERRMLIQQLRKLQEMFPLVLCASIRLDAENSLVPSSGQFIATSITSIPDENPDIEAFIEAELASCIESKELVIGDPSLILKIQDTLLEGSQGMFLWVALQIKSLCLMKTDDAILQALADLPKDLSETFSHILLRSEASRKPYQRRILELIAVARRPLTIEELREALSVVPGDAVWNPARLLNDIFSTLTCCGSLLTVDEEELTVRFVHHSVKQFLFSGFKDSNNITFTIDSAEKKMADIIVTYLSYGVFGTQLSTMVVPQIRAGSAPSRIILSTLEPSSSVRNLTLKLLKSRKRPNCDIGPILAEASELFNSHSVDEFHFFFYAKSYWLQHILCTSDQEPAMYGLLLRVFQGNVVNTDAVDEDGRLPLWLAVDNGHEALVKLLLDSSKVDINLKDNHYGWTPLLLAAGNGNEAIVKLLLDSSKVDVSLEDKNGQTPLSLAAKNGNEAIVKLLLDSGKADINLKDSLHGWTPLSLAAAKGHETVVKLLLDSSKVDVNTKDNISRTPLLWAVRYGNEAIVKLLLDSGKADVNSKDNNSRTPLLWAAGYGYEATVKLLLGSSNVDINSKDSCSWTPLSLAVDCGHDAVVELLLNTGKVNANLNIPGGQTPLSFAAGNGCEATVKLLLDSGKVDVNLKDNNGWTPLSLAARNGHEATVKLLLDSSNVDINSRDSNSRTPLSIAVDNGHEAVVKLLLDTGKADVNSYDMGGWTPLSSAARNGREAIVKLLLDFGKVDVNSEDSSGYAPLSLAVMNRHEAVVMLLLNSSNADINSNDKNGQTPLSFAVQNGHEAIVMLLLNSSNVDANSKDNGGWTPLSLAVQNEREAIVKLLLDSGKMDVDSKDNYGWTPLSFAVAGGYEAIVKLLLDSGKVDVNSKTKYGHTALSFAAKHGHDAIVKLLLDSSEVDVNAKDSDGCTPLSFAVGNGHEATVKLLLDSGKVDVNLRENRNGWTPLSFAAGNGHEAIVKLLLDSGNVDVNSKDNYGETPISRATKNKHKAIVKLLQSSVSV